MVVSMSVTALGCLVIEVSPTYSSVGLVAPTLLVLGVCFKDLALGARSVRHSLSSLKVNHPIAAVFGLAACSLPHFGSLLATIVALILNAVSPAGAIQAYGWRIPFLVGALLGIYAIFLRRGLEEPEVFKSEVAHEQAIGAHTSMWQAILENRKAVIAVIGLTADPTLSYNTWVAGATTYAINFKHMNAREAFWALLIGCIVYIVLQPLWEFYPTRSGENPIS